MLTLVCCLPSFLVAEAILNTGLADQIVVKVLLVDSVQMDRNEFPFILRAFAFTNPSTANVLGPFPALLAHHALRTSCTPFIASAHYSRHNET